MNLKERVEELEKKVILISKYIQLSSKNKMEIVKLLDKIKI